MVKDRQDSLFEVIDGLDGGRDLHGLWSDKRRGVYLSFASLLGVADVLESIVHDGHSNHCGGVFYENNSKLVAVINSECRGELTL